MEIKYVFILIALMVICDFAAVNISFITTYNVIADIGSHDYLLYLLSITVLNLIWLFAALYTKLYHLYSIQNIRTILLKSINTFIMYAVVAIIVIAAAGYQTLLFAITFIAFELALLTISRTVIYASGGLHQKLPAYGRKIAIIGCNDTGNNLKRYFLRNKMSYTFAGFFDEPRKDQFLNDNEIVGGFTSVVDYAVKNDVKEVYSTKFPEDVNSLSDIFSLAEKHCIKIRFASSIDDVVKPNYHLRYFFDDINILTQRSDPLDLLENRIVKRMFDLVFSAFVCVFILSWLFPLLGIIIKLESPGPVLFMQLRSGRNNQPFWCYKFRSMTVNTDSDHKQASKGDLRITRIGAFMRKTSIDELPQFINALIGNMSVVGPRPHMLKHTDQYKQIVDEYMIRHFIKPGITGWAQVNGYRGETRDEQQMINRVEHDIWYVSNWSVLTDIKTIVLTMVNAVKGEKNAY